MQAKVRRGRDIKGKIAQVGGAMIINENHDHFAYLQILTCHAVESAGCRPGQNMAAHGIGGVGNVETARLRA